MDTEKGNSECPTPLIFWAEYLQVPFLWDMVFPRVLCFQHGRPPVSKGEGLLVADYLGRRDPTRRDRAGSPTLPAS